MHPDFALRRLVARVRPDEGERQTLRDRCGGKVQAISQLIKIWRFAGSPPVGVSSLYVDMMLASSDIASASRPTASVYTASLENACG
jgi:hypothetical protein